MKALLLVLLIACDNGDATPDWSRMITQPKLLPYGASAQFADGRAMRPVPAGVVAREQAPPRAEITTALLERGRNRFLIVCAVCHGTTGEGDTPVAYAMQRRRPPSLHEPRLVALSVDDLDRVIANGYGLMPSYATLLTPADRWAVIAYTRRLQR